jgi:aspartyl-tRNA(Asn)/glutamyl-tRNA(Gln) amidotransferase subunit A
MAMYLNDITTIPANLAGVPGLGMPIGLAPEDGLPVGLQIMAPAREDARLYTVAAALEAVLETEWGGPLLDRAPALGLHGAGGTIRTTPGTAPAPGAGTEPDGGTA